MAEGDDASASGEDEESRRRREATRRRFRELHVANTMLERWATDDFRFPRSGDTSALDRLEREFEERQRRGPDQKGEP